MDPCKASDPVFSWAELLDRIRDRDEARAAITTFAATAGKILELPLLQRVHRFEDVGIKGRTWLDKRCFMSDPDMKEHFALAMSDMRMAGRAGVEVRATAAACRLTGNPVFADRAVAQLREMATWSPVQRPGWTCFSKGGRLPPDGKDGNWLATGEGIRGIVDGVEILPQEFLPADLAADIQELLEKEIDSIVDDWETRRPWFVRADNPYTNQWVLPTEGLVRACLYLGRERHAAAYALGKANMTRAIDCRSPEGAFEEGLAYADGTVTSMLHATRAMAVDGDPTLFSRPFLRNYPVWYVQHLQPAGFLINAFDAFNCARKTGAESTASLRETLALLAVCTGNRDAQWAVSRLPGGVPDTFAGLLFRGLPALDEEFSPPTFASYDRARRVNWRDSWDDQASGVWIRGGHEHDQHDHNDRGHVNLIIRGNPILIEAGTPAYHHPKSPTHFCGAVGHNVLQIGTFSPDDAEDARQGPPQGLQLSRGRASLQVRRLDARGGDVRVDGSTCYAETERWVRDVEWTATAMTVRDEVILKARVTDVITLRWHLGTPGPVELQTSGEQIVASWEGVTLQAQADSCLTVEQAPMPDHTLVEHDWDDDSAYNQHACLMVQTAAPVQAVSMITVIRYVS